MELVFTLFTKELVMLSEVAALIGTRQRTFIEQLGQYQLPLLNEESLAALPQEVADASYYLQH